MSQFFAASKSKTLPANQAHAFSSTQCDDQASKRHVDVVILGTGFSGLGMAIRLKRKGYENFVVLEQGIRYRGNLA